MKKFAGAAAFLLISAVAAFSAEAEGEIRKVDKEKLVITLDDGKSYKLPAEMDMSGIEEGMAIILAYEQVGGQNQITDMQISE